MPEFIAGFPAISSGFNGAMLQTGGSWGAASVKWDLKRHSRHELGFHHASRSSLNVSYFLVLWNILQKSSTTKIDLSFTLFTQTARYFVSLTRKR